MAVCHGALEGRMSLSGLLLGGFDRTQPRAINRCRYRTSWPCRTA
jgi:hypothetical protein